MGPVFARAYRRLLEMASPSLDIILRQIIQSPGLPAPNSSLAYWAIPPAPISQHNGDPRILIPEYADVVIIGSGITGTSFARAILDWSKLYGPDLLKVVMLEARDTCSGATGRNGGHIAPILYSEYGDLKNQYGTAVAKEIIRFRLSHLPELLSVAEREGLQEESQCREVEAFDVFCDAALFDDAKSRLAVYREDLPAESQHYKTYESAESLKNLQLSSKFAGCLSTRGGALHPYRLVTGILSRLLRDYPSRFHLYTQTPCTAISSNGNIPLYQATTSKGVIRTPHIVHATNAWISHLLPGLRRKVIPARGVMTAQRPRTSDFGSDSANTQVHVPLFTSDRSFVFYHGKSTYTYDYLTQQPTRMERSEDSIKLYPRPQGEIMLGCRLAPDAWFIGCADDRERNPETCEYLAKALDGYFQEGQNPQSTERVISMWSGILGLSVDEKPWVGRVPEIISGRRQPELRTMTDKNHNGAALDNTLRACGIERRSFSFPSASRMAAPGEWVAAGYTGEGMVHAWMCGKALAHMVLNSGRCGLWKDKSGHLVRLPEPFRITEGRWRNTWLDKFKADQISL